MISIVFVSNFFNHHEKYFCDALYSNPNVDFHFVQTQPMDEERIKLGWGIDIGNIPYCVCSYGENQKYERTLELCDSADVVILGSAPYDFVSNRIKNNKFTFYYAERLFRKGLWHMFYPKTFFTVLKRFILPGRKSNFYLLAASGYTAIDTKRIFAFKNRRFKWGHFIDVTHLEKRKEESNHEVLRLLWVGRFLKLKHPEYPIQIAKTLKDKNKSFVLDIIGTGEQEAYIKDLIAKLDLFDVVKLHGSMKPEEVRDYMQKADIYMFTSDFNEGWGAVLGESMISGCAVVTGHGIGATPFLVSHKENGLVYETGNYSSFERNVIYLVESKDLREKLSQNAIETMRCLWNPQVAADRFYRLCESLLTTGTPVFYENGPLSKAELIKNNWFRDDSI